MKASLWNWFCVACREWRGIDTINESKRCKTCGSRCVWTQYETDDDGQPVAAEVQP